MTRVPYLVAEITVAHREGCYHAYSEDVEGFHLCADSLAALDHDVPAALEFLFRVKHNMIVKAERAASPKELHAGKQTRRRAPEAERFVMTPEFAYA